MVKVVWVVLRGGRHGDVRSLTRHGGGAQVTGSPTHLENSHTLRISKKREPVLSISLKVVTLQQKLLDASLPEVIHHAHS